MGKVKKKRLSRNFAEIDPKFSFLKGWGDLKQRDVDVAKRELMETLKIKADATFYRRLRGQIVPTVEEYNQVLDVFKKYGVKQPYGV